MTLTLEITPDNQRILEAAAQANGQSLSDYAAHILALEAAELAQDMADVEEAERRTANSDPSKRRTLAELRAAIDEKKRQAA